MYSRSNGGGQEANVYSNQQSRAKGRGRGENRIKRTTDPINMVILCPFLSKQQREKGKKKRQTAVFHLSPLRNIKDRRRKRESKDFSEIRKN